MIEVQQPLFTPETKWTMPSSLPDLRPFKAVAWDFETYDPELKTTGLSFVKRTGKPVGIAYYASENGLTKKGYIPFAHSEGPNIDQEIVVRWLKEQIEYDNLKVFANAAYDYECFHYLGIKFPSKVWDIINTESLIEEEAYDNSLNELAFRYLGERKEEDLLEKAAKAYGVDPKSGLWLLPPKFVGGYAETDARQTFEIYLQQKDIIVDQQLEEVQNLEMRIIPLTVKMKFKGVRIDTDEAEKLYNKWKKLKVTLKKDLEGVEVWSSDSLYKYAKANDLPYETTKKGNPSFTKAFLENSELPFYKKVVEYREIDKLHEEFLRQNIIEMSYNGRIHTNFHPCKRGEGGTRTGRFSCSKPNLQQVPSRTEMGKQLRRLFIPDEGHRWASLDYSQQEYRVLVHYAALLKARGADDVVYLYQKTPDIDFHQAVANLTGVTRKEAKNINFGLVYGMGISKLATKLGVGYDRAEELLEIYHREAPFVKKTADKVASIASNRGWIKTLGGRHRHFNLWEPSSWSEHKYIPLPLLAARDKWPNQPLSRAGTYKALNSLIQGSSADMMKKALVLTYEQLDVVPHLTVHDEIDASIQHEKEALAIKEIMESAYELKVPILADMEIGNNWGECK